MSAPLSPVFLDHLQTLFSLLDDKRTGHISLSSIETNWARGVAGLPHDFIPCLYQVASTDGTLSFNQFVRGVRLSMTGRNKGGSSCQGVMSKSWTEGYSKQAAGPHQERNGHKTPISPPSYSTYMNTRSDLRVGQSQHPTRSAMSLPRPANGSETVHMRKSVTLDPAAFKTSRKVMAHDNNNEDAMTRNSVNVDPAVYNHRSDYEPINVRKSVTLDPTSFKHSQNGTHSTDSESVVMRKSVTLDPAAFSSSSRHHRNGGNNYSNGTSMTPSSQHRGRPPDVPPRPASSLMRTKPLPPPRTVSRQQPRRPVSCHPSISSQADIVSPMRADNGGHYERHYHPNGQLEEDSDSSNYQRLRSQSFQTSSTLIGNPSSFSDGHGGTSRSLQLERRALKDCLCCLEKARARLQCRLDSINERLTAPVLAPEPPHGGGDGCAATSATQIPLMQARVDQACQLLLALSAGQQEGHLGSGGASISRSNSRAGPSSTILLSPSSVESDLRSQVDALSKEVSQCKLSIRQLEREKSCLVRELFDKRRPPSVLSSSVPLSTDI